jgi:hypothetical protein
VRNIVKLFEGDCFVDPESVRRAASTRSMFNIIHDARVIKADLVVRKDERYRVTEFGRRRTIIVEGRPLAFVAPEDLILSKLLWARDSGSEMQERDVRDLLDAVDDLDLDYIRAWAADLDVGGALERLRER